MFDNKDEKKEREQINLRISKEEKNIWKEFLSFTECANLSEFIKFSVNKQIRKMQTGLLTELKKELDKHKYVFESISYEISSKHIIAAYLLKKPLASIDLYQIDFDIEPFVMSMNEFFFTDTNICKESGKMYSAEIFVSRFKNIIDIISDHKRDHEIADLYGILYGYSPKEVYDYCVKRKYNSLIK